MYLFCRIFYLALTKGKYLMEPVIQFAAGGAIEVLVSGVTGPGWSQLSHLVMPAQPGTTLRPGLPN